MGSSKINTSLEPYENCPRFKTGCSINKCHLHPKYNDLDNSPEDFAMKNKHKCCSKNCRMRIASAYELKQKGLTNKEFQAKQKWNNLPEKEKQRRIEKMRRLSPVSKLLSAGHTIIPKRTKQSQKPYTKKINTPKNSPYRQVSKGDETSKTISNPELKKPLEMPLNASRVEGLK